MCCQDEEHRQGLRSEDSEQVGNVEESGDSLFSRGERCSGVWRQTLDHQSSLCLSGHHEPSEYLSISLSQPSNKISRTALTGAMLSANT